MSWETLAYTDAGIELLMDAVSGKQLTITQAVGGSGLANAAVLHAHVEHRLVDLAELPHASAEILEILAARQSDGSVRPDEIGLAHHAPRGAAQDAIL